MTSRPYLFHLQSHFTGHGHTQLTLWHEQHERWCVHAVLVAVTACLSMDSSHMAREPVAVGGACAWGAPLLCTVSAALGVTTMLTYCAVGVYFILYVAYLWRAWTALKVAQYQKYRTANLVLRVQVCP